MATCDARHQFPGHRHVDEIINFVPTSDGFNVLLASPYEGRRLLERLAKRGLGAVKMLAGKEAEASINDILTDKKLIAANARAESIMARNRKVVEEQLGLKEHQLVNVPLMFNDTGLSVWPNIVNGLVVANQFVCPRPFGPRVNGVDAVESEFRELLSRTLAEVHFVDVYEAYSLKWGECHCGTNVVRQPTEVN